jgi:predicted phage terminase large subunit-like protein
MERANRKVLSVVLREDFVAFAERAFREVEPRGKLQLENYVLLVGQMLTSVADRSVRRLIVNLPPRHLKSFLVSVFFPCWILLRDPRTKIMIVCHHVTLAEHFCRLIRQIMRSDWYQAAFPGARISDDRNTASECVTTAGGGVRALSMRSGVTGSGADIIIVDDPLDAKDAASETERSTVNKAFDEALISRIDDPRTGAIIVVGQRLHPRDLSGGLLEKGGWQHLCLPFIALEDVEYKMANGIWRRNKDEVLSPARFGPKEVAAVRREQPPHVFATQWQQQPTAISSGWVSEADFPKSPTAPHQCSRCIMSWDPALKDGLQSNYSACVIARELHDRIFIVDVWRGRVDFERLCLAARRLIERWKPTHILVEDSALGPALDGTLKRCGQNSILRSTRGKSKEDRLQNNLDRIKAHHVVLCAGTWNACFLDELIRFPFGDDDQVDALTQALTFIRENPPPPPKEFATNPGRAGLVSRRNPQRDPRLGFAWR